MLGILREMEHRPAHNVVNLDFRGQNGFQLKQSGHIIHNRDSSSTQSTDHSLQEGSGMSDISLNGRHNSTQSDNDDRHERWGQDKMRSILSLGKSEAAFPSPKLDYNHSFSCIPYPYAEQSYGGVLTPYGSYNNIHTQMASSAASRVPLPIEPATEEPIFVNAKQYHAILRRRQIRAKLEVQNKLVKVRKPYLHESRHLHAMKRARGSGGRFLNTKQLQQQQLQRQPSAGIGCPKNLGKELCTKNKNGPTCSPTTPTSSDITTVSTSGSMLLHQDHISFSSAGFLAHAMFSTQSGGDKTVVNGAQHHVPSVR